MAKIVFPYPCNNNDVYDVLGDFMRCFENFAETGDHSALARDLVKIFGVMGGNDLAQKVAIGQATEFIIARLLVDDPMPFQFGCSANYHKENYNIPDLTYPNISSDIILEPLLDVASSIYNADGFFSVYVAGALAQVNAKINEGIYDDLERDKMWRPLCGLELFQRYRSLDGAVDAYIASALGGGVSYVLNELLGRNPQALNVLENRQKRNNLVRESHAEQYFEYSFGNILEKCSVDGLIQLRSLSEIWKVVSGVEEMDMQLLCIELPPGLSTITVDPEECFPKSYVGMTSSHQGKDYFTLLGQYCSERSKLNLRNVVPDPSWVDELEEGRLCGMFKLLAHAKGVIVNGSGRSVLSSQAWTLSQAPFLPHIKSDVTALWQRMNALGMPIPSVKP